MKTDGLDRWASVGDTITTTLSDGRVLRASLDTPEACAYGNELIAVGRWNKEENSPATGERA